MSTIINLSTIFYDSGYFLAIYITASPPIECPSSVNFSYISFYFSINYFKSTARSLTWWDFVCADYPMYYNIYHGF